MISTHYEPDNLVSIAKTYYQHMLEKNFEAMAASLHPEIHFISPLAELTDKSAVVDAAKKLSGLLETITIRSAFSHENQIMMAYDFMFPEPIGKLRAAVLMHVKENLIASIELFYDGRPFQARQDAIFSPSS